MQIFQIGFVVLVIVFGLLFISRNRISSTFKVVTIVLVFILGIMISFDTFFDNGFGYSTPVDVEISNETESDLKTFGVLTYDGCCDNTSFVYSFGKIKPSHKSLKTIEAECVYDFSILSFDDSDKIVYVEKMGLSKKASLQISSIDRLEKKQSGFFKDRIDEFENEQSIIDLYKFGIIFFSILTLFLIFKKNNGAN